MPNDNSVAIVVTAAALDNANAALACLFGDDPGAENLDVALSSTGSAPATHYGTNVMRTGDEATALKDWPNGVLPVPMGSWGDYGLDSTTALAAMAASVADVQVKTGGDQNTLGLVNFNSLIDTLGLQVVA